MRDIPYSPYPCDGDGPRALSVSESICRLDQDRLSDVLESRIVHVSEQHSMPQ